MNILCRGRDAALSGPCPLYTSTNGQVSVTIVMQCPKPLSRPHPFIRMPGTNHGSISHLVSNSEVLQDQGSPLRAFLNSTIYTLHHQQKAIPYKPKQLSFREHGSRKTLQKLYLYCHYPIKTLPSVF